MLKLCLSCLDIDKSRGEILRKRSIFAVCGAAILVLMTASITPAVHAQPIVSIQSEIENKMSNMDFEKAKNIAKKVAYLIERKGIRWDETSQDRYFEEVLGIVASLSMEEKSVLANIMSSSAVISEVNEMRVGSNELNVVKTAENEFVSHIKSLDSSDLKEGLQKLDKSTITSLSNLLKQTNNLATTPRIFCVFIVLLMLILYALGTLFWSLGLYGLATLVGSLMEMLYWIYLKCVTGRCVVVSTTNYSIYTVRSSGVQGVVEPTSALKLS